MASSSDCSFRGDVTTKAAADPASETKTETDSAREATNTKRESRAAERKSGWKLIGKKGLRGGEDGEEESWEWRRRGRRGESLGEERWALMEKREGEDEEEVREEARRRREGEVAAMNAESIEHSSLGRKSERTTRVGLGRMWIVKRTNEDVPRGENCLWDQPSIYY